MRTAIALFFTGWFGITTANALSESDINAAMKASVSTMNQQAPIERGDWIFTKASYSPGKRTVTYNVRDKTALLSEISVDKYKKLAATTLKQDVCKRGSEIRKYGLNVVYAISDRNGRFITNTAIRTSSC